MKIKIDSLDNIHVAAKEFLENMGDGKVFAFYGKMGAGKTTFVKAICEELGVEDVITSPTFALVNEYTAGNGDPIYHFDFYRIKKIDEVYDMGYEDYFYGGNLCFLEWPELIEDLLPEDCTKYQDFVEHLVDIETEYTYKYMEATQFLQEGSMITEEFLHIMSRAMFDSMFEVVRHRMDRDTARKYLHMLEKYHYGGWGAIIKLG